MKTFVGFQAPATLGDLSRQAGRSNATRTFSRSVIATVVVKGHLSAFAILLSLWATSLSAQESQRHFRSWADLPPGQIGRDQLARGGALRGYFQPVEVGGPRGSQVALHVEGAYAPNDQSTARAGMLIGEVYRYKITNIPGHPGTEIYPTVEVIDRLYPPEGQLENYPIPVHVTPEEIEMVLDGKFITRVVYLEDPEIALPVAQRPDTQRVLDIGAVSDPLRVADTLGRPMLILRIGSRVPLNNDTSGLFEFASPPIQVLD